MIKGLINLPLSCRCHLPPGQWCQKYPLGFFCPKGGKQSKSPDVNIYIFVSFTAFTSTALSWVGPSGHLWITAGPVVSGASTVLRQVDVLGVVEICIRGVENGVDHPGLQVQENSPGDVVLIISLSDSVETKEPRLSEHYSAGCLRGPWTRLISTSTTITPSSGRKCFCIRVIRNREYLHPSQTWNW